MANPDPEITPEDVLAVRDDAIVATGRSDYPNQINNVLGFPFIFRGALDVQASTINEAMKIAAAEALAELARAEVPDQVAAAFHGRRPTFGPEYIIPAPFDPRLIVEIPTAVAKAAMDSGVARKPIVDMDAYVAQLKGRLDPLAGWLQSTFSAVRLDPKRVVFAEAEEPAVIRAAHSYFTQGFGVPILIGSADVVREQFRALGMVLRPEYELIDTRKSAHLEEFADFLYARLQRRGYLKRDCQRLVANERNIFGALMVVHGHADALVSGVTRNWTSVYDDVQRVLDRRARAATSSACRWRCCAGAPCSSPTPACTTCRRRKSSPTSPPRRRAPRATSAWSRAWRCSPTPPSASRAANAPTRCARPWRSSMSGRSTSSTTATWPPTSRSIAS